MGYHVKGRLAKKLKSLIQVPYVAHMKEQVPGFNMILISSPQCVPSPSYPFWDQKTRGQVKGGSPKKLKSLIEIPYVAQVKVQVLRLNMMLSSSP